MGAPPQVLIYGANGYCGRLLARAARERGLAPLLAGRRAGPIEAVAGELGLPCRVFEPDRPELAVAALDGIRVLLNAAGPFAATAAELISACCKTGTHYLDITGEIDVFVAAQRRHEEARSAGIVLCPGAGFDVVPTDCVAAVLKDALPDATELALGFEAATAMSPGSARTIAETLKLGCRIRRNGEIVSVPFGSDKRRIDFGAGESWAIALAWGDVATAYFSTGIPNIRVYLGASRVAAAIAPAMNVLRPLLEIPALERGLSRWAHAANRGPDERQFHHGVSRIWGEARNGTGKKVAARLITPDAYRLTIDAAIMVLEHLLRESPQGGFYTPSRLMGARCVERLPDVGAIRLN
jgi:short subunit dehydrogenase-like uncharacterized protein